MFFTRREAAARLLGSGGRGARPRREAIVTWRLAGSLQAIARGVGRVKSGTATVRVFRADATIRPNTKTSSRGAVSARQTAWPLESRLCVRPSGRESLRWQVRLD